MKFEYAQETLRRGEIFFPAPASFNDPFDFRIAPVFDGPASAHEELYKQVLRDDPHLRNRAERRRELRQVRPYLDETVSEEAFQAVADDWVQNRGVLSFSAMRNDILMWSHYADKHTGVCLGFDTGNEFFKATREVSYADDYPQINMLDLSLLLSHSDRESMDRSENVLIRALFLTKASHWTYEPEWHLIRIEPGVRRTRGWHAFPAASLKEIIIGARATETRVTQIRRLLETRPMYNAELLRARSSRSRFALDIAPAEQSVTRD